MNNKAFTNSKMFYITANIREPSNLATSLDQRTNLLLKGKPPKNQSPYHITLLQFEINTDHVDSKFFETHLSELRDYALFAYDTSFAYNGTKLTYVQGKYDLLGQTANKFLCKIYNVQNGHKRQITLFRKQVYAYLKQKLGEYTIENNTANNGFAIFSLKGKPLIAVPAYYYGIGVWTPHVSIVNTGDVMIHNKELYDNYVTQNNQLAVLLQPIYSSRLRPLGDICMNNDIGSLTVSVGKTELSKNR